MKKLDGETTVVMNIDMCENGADQVLKSSIICWLFDLLYSRVVQNSTHDNQHLHTARIHKRIQERNNQRYKQIELP